MEKFCPVCQSPMNHILPSAKTNPKSPDWKCSNRDCKWKWNAPTGQYVPSAYITGSWDTLPQNEAIAPRPASKQAEIKQMYDQKREDIREMHDAKQSSILVIASQKNACIALQGNPNVNGALINSLAESNLAWIQEKLFDKIMEKPPFN